MLHPHLLQSQTFNWTVPRVNPDKIAHWCYTYPHLLQSQTFNWTVPRVNLDKIAHWCYTPPRPFLLDCN